MNKAIYSTNAATAKVRLVDVHWLAAYLDSEACFLSEQGTPKITACSIDEDLISKCHSLLGGTLNGPKQYAENQQPQWRWQLSGARAIGAMMTAFPLLCNRRRWKIAFIWKDWHDREASPGLKTHCRNGHPLFGDNLRLWGKRKQRVCYTCHSQSSKRAEAKIRATKKEASLACVA